MEKEVKKDENEKNDEQVILKKENKKKDNKPSKKQHDNNLSLDDMRMILIEELKPKRELLLDEDLDDESEDTKNE